jgi:hypothetical protein
VISSSQRPLPDNTQQTKIHAPGGIRTQDRSRRAAVDLRLDCAATGTGNTTTATATTTTAITTTNNNNNNNNKRNCCVVIEMYAVEMAAYLILLAVPC